MEDKPSTNLNVSASEFIPKILPLPPNGQVIVETVKALETIFADPESYPYPLESIFPHFVSLQDDSLLNQFIDTVIEMSISNNNVQYIASKCVYYLHKNLSTRTRDEFIMLLCDKCQKRNADLRNDIHSALFTNLALFQTELMINLTVNRQRQFAIAVSESLLALLESPTDSAVKAITNLIKLTWRRLEREVPDHMNLIFLRIDDIICDNQFSAMSRTLLLELTKGRKDHLKTIEAENLANTNPIENVLNGLSLDSNGIETEVIYDDSILPIGLNNGAYLGFNYSSNAMPSGFNYDNNGIPPGIFFDSNGAPTDSNIGQSIHNNYYNCEDAPEYYFTHNSRPEDVAKYEDYVAEDGTHYFYSTTASTTTQSGYLDPEADQEMYDDYEEFVLENESPVMDAEAEADYDEYLRSLPNKQQ